MKSNKVLKVISNQSFKCYCNLIILINFGRLRGIRTPSCKTGNVQDHISSGHEPSAGTFLRKSCLRRSLSDHCLGEFVSLNNL